MDPEKIKAIREWEAPKTKKRVRAFLRFANYYRAFIDKFVTTAAPLTALTGKHPFHWTAEAQKTFESLCDGPWPGLYYFRPLAGTYRISLMV